MSEDAVEVETDEEESIDSEGASEQSDANTALSDRLETIDGIDADLVDEVAGLESRVRTLEGELDERESEVDDLKGRVKRIQADFQNYKQRAKRQQEEIKERAAEDVLERIVPVRDNLVRALGQDADADIRPGVESTLEEFDRVLESEGVELIEPDPGAEVDPTRHQVMLRVDSDRPEGTVDELYQPGYELGDRVIREAQVTVSDGDSGGESGTDENDETDE